MGNVFSDIKTAAESGQSWVTLATNDSYALGALVLAHSLKRVATTRRLTLLAGKAVTPPIRALLEAVYDDIVDVSPIDSGDIRHLELLERPDLGITFTKLHCWKLTQFSKCVFLDADTMVVKNCDELFDRAELSAVPDAGWPDCFNSGVFVFRPSMETFQALVDHAEQKGSFDGGDQGLLNTFFSGWQTEDISKHLSFIYNMCATATYTYMPAYKYFGQNVKIVHFIGASKPWHVPLDAYGQPVPGVLESHASEHLKVWWNIFRDHVKQQLPPQTLVKALSTTNPNTPARISREDLGAAGPEIQSDRREDWESGRPDFRGRASFDNILKKIEGSIRDKDERRE